LPASPGTVVEAEDLFFNTPARLKFLKSAQAEMTQTLRLLQGIALACPGIHLRVTHNGRAVLNAPRAGGLRDRVGALLWFDLATKMLDVGGAISGVTVSGLVAPPQLSRGNRDAITLIVNGRPVRDTLLQQALVDAHRPLLARDQFPVAVLHIDLPSREVDVNVHPTKAWVRFRSPRVIQEAVFTAVQAALRSPRVVQSQEGLVVASDTAAFPQGAETVTAATASGQPGTVRRGVGCLRRASVRRRGRPAPGDLHRRRERG
jgi:DNA mismatch repair protein MutL